MSDRISPTVGHRTIALVGAKGMLAHAILNTAPEGYRISCYDLPEFDLTDRSQVLSALDSLRPDIIINCAAFTDVDGCESQEELATSVNGSAVANLAEAAKAVGALLVHVSTDYVFDGSKCEPYLEDDAVAPQSAYGRSKLMGEQAILQSGLTNYFIVRTSWLYGPGGRNFVETMLRLAADRDELRVVADQVGSPTYTLDLASAIFNLLKIANTHQQPPEKLFGIYHFSNGGQCSWFDFASEIIRFAEVAGSPVKVKQVQPIRTEDYPLPATRPTYSVFSKDKYRKMTGEVVPEWRESLASYFERRL